MCLALTRAFCTCCGMCATRSPYWITYRTYIKYAFVSILFLKTKQNGINLLERMCTTPVHNLPSLPQLYVFIGTERTADFGSHCLHIVQLINRTALLNSILWATLDLYFKIKLTKLPKLFTKLFCVIRFE